MQKLFNERLQQAANSARDCSNQELMSTEFRDQVYDDAKIVTPRLNKNNIKISLGEQIMTSSNAPNGVYYTPGKPLDYAEFAIAIIGKATIMEDLLKNLILNSQGYIQISGQKLIIRELSTDKISGNDGVIEYVKEQAKHKIYIIEKSLNDFDNEVLIFNKLLLSTIDDVIEEERIKRKTDNDTLDKLKLF
jgi:hypothetical protein